VFQKGSANIKVGEGLGNIGRNLYLTPFPKASFGFSGEDGVVPL
jgi:hypothetical protein